LRSGEQAVTIVLARSALEGVEGIFGKYGVVSDFQFATAEERVLTVQGPKATFALTLEGPIAFQREMDHVKTPVGGVTVRLLRHDRSGHGGLDLLVPTSDAAKVLEAIRAPRATPAELDLVRLEAGRASFGRDFGPDTIPQEARLEEKEEDALSFDKGCFFGQEVVARLRFRGHVNKLLVPLVLEGEAPEGALLEKDGKEVGKLTSVASSPFLGKRIALGYVRREHANPGTGLTSNGVPVKVVSRGWNS
jgi:folate-binding protein YgfZ